MSTLPPSRTSGFISLPPLSSTSSFLLRPHRHQVHRVHRGYRHSPSLSLSAASPSSKRAVHHESPAPTGAASVATPGWARRDKQGTSQSKARHMMRMTEDQLISRIAGCTRRNDWYSAHIAFQSYMYFGNDPFPSSKLLGAYIHALCKNGQLEMAQRVFATYLPSSNTEVIQTTLISHTAKWHGVNAAIVQLKSLHASLWSSHLVTALIHTLGNEERYQDAFYLFQLARGDKYQVTVDLQMCNALMRAVCRKGQLKLAYKLLKVMKSYRISPDDVTYQAVLLAYFHRKDVDEEGVGMADKEMLEKAKAVYDGCIAKGLLSPRVDSAFASVVLKYDYNYDDTIIRLIEQMHYTVTNCSKAQLKKMGVDMHHFRSKLNRLIELRRKLYSSSPNFPGNLPSPRLQLDKDVTVQRLDLTKLNF